MQKKVHVYKEHLIVSLLLFLSSTTHTHLRAFTLLCYFLLVAFCVCVCVCLCVYIHSNITSNIHPISIPTPDIIMPHSVHGENHNGQIIAEKAKQDADMSSYAGGSGDAQLVANKVKG